jgi:glutamine synthetase
MNLLNAEGFFEDGGFEYVRFEQSDLNGLSRSKTVPVRHFRQYAENGLNFFGGLLSLTASGDILAAGESAEDRRFDDQVIWPDPRTLSSVPWVPKTARVLSEPSRPDGTPVLAGPRLIARTQVQRLTDLGYTIRGSFDYQFYLVESLDGTPVSPRRAPFLSRQNEFDPEFMIELLDNLSSAGVDVTMSSASFGPGQMSISFASAVGINGTDQAFTFKNGVKEMAGLHGYTASFMTFPMPGADASGGVLSQSLLDRRGVNLFHDAMSSNGLSPLACHWIGGQVRHAAALAAICAPTVNCFKRYRSGVLAPANASWALDDATAAIRVLGAGRPDVRIENRLPGAASNPYLVASAVIAAGLDGITNSIEPPPASAGVASADAAAPPLPQSLDEALDALQADTALVAALGASFVDLFVAVKRSEIEAARTALPEYESADWATSVSDWERESYFDIF